MGRLLMLLYGVFCYVLFLGTFVYAAAFVGNILLPHSIDSMPRAPIWYAVLVNSALLGIFAVQHSLMARKQFKDKWTKIVPPAAERSTYVLFSSLALILLFAYWEPMGGVVWRVTDYNIKLAIQTACVCGWLVVLVSTFLIDHFELFGLKQVYNYFRGRPMTHKRFMTPLFYKYVRHPIYFGFAVAFWATPTMTLAHLLFAFMCTAYIFVGIYFEEKDLEAHFGDEYRQYKKDVAKLVPSVKKIVQG